MLKKLLFLVITLVGFTTFAQDFSIRGFVYDDSNMEPLSDIKVKLLRTDSSVIAGAFTNLNGGFLIPKLVKGSYILKIETGRFKKAFINVNMTDKYKIYDVQFKLIRNSQDMKEVIVNIDSKDKKNEILIGTLRYNQKSLDRIPSHGGENDIVGAISVTPGVVTTGDQGGQLYVRGGTPIQNKVLLDGMTIYNPFHSIGFFSIFETELVKNVDVYTGGFESKYGGRVSSVMDITYRDGNRREFGGRVSVSPFLAKMVLEGPIGKVTKEKAAPGSYVFSAKHSLLDNTSKSLYPKVNDGKGLPFNFTDLYGKVTFNGDGGTKVSAFGFHNQDSVNYDIADLKWDASGGGVNFLMVPSGSPMFIRGHVNGSNYQTTFAETAQEPRYSKIGGFDLGFDFSYFLKNESEMNYGFNINGFNTEFVTYNAAKRKIEATNFTTEIGSYFNYRLIKRRWVIQTGMRVQVYASLNTISPEPRLGLKYNANENLRFKFSGGRFSQNFTSASSDKDVVNLFNGLLSAPTNVQEQFVTQFQNVKNTKNGLQYAWHAILGMEYDLGKYWSFNVETYYKYFSQLSNINQNKLYDDVSQFELIDDVYKKDFIIETGQSYGFDFLAKYSKDRLFLWAVYSYGKNTRWDGFANYAPVFDRRHNVNLVGSYLFGKEKNYELNIRWNLGSGLPFTPTAGYYQGESFSGGVTSNYVTNNPSAITTLLGGFNSQRLPYYHRLDITFKKQFNFKNKDVLEMIASVTNVYNRNNIFYINRITSEKIYQFPILPSFGLNYKF
jgi:hypothetical protein